MLSSRWLSSAKACGARQSAKMSVRNRMGSSLSQSSDPGDPRLAAGAEAQTDLIARLGLWRSAADVADLCTEGQRNIDFLAYFYGIRANLRADDQHFRGIG